MKKLIYVICTVLILSLCLSFTSLAAETTQAGNTPVVTFSEDFRTLYYKDYEYHQKNLDAFTTYMNIDEDYEYDGYPEYDDTFIGSSSIVINSHFLPFSANYKLSEAQEKIVDYVDLNGDDIIIYLTVYYKDGTSFTLDLLREDYLDDYDALLQGKSDDYMIEYDWPEGNNVKVSKTKLMENKSMMIKHSYVDYEFQSVYVHSDDLALSYTPGFVINYNDRYYYVDYAENETKIDLDYYVPYYLEQEFSGHEITDEKTLEGIKAAEEKYYEDDYGYLYNDELANTISYFFLILLFGVIPGIIFVLSLVFAFIKKKTYRKLLFAVSFFTLAEIIVFIIFMILANFK